MKLSAELLDHIFSFLVSHRDRATLIACLKVPVLSQIVEKHLYYTITVTSDVHTTFRLSKFIDENPRILHYVRILRIRIHFALFVDSTNEALSHFANTLLMFPVLECVKLIAFTSQRYQDWPGFFRAALADRLKLPTLKELHIDGGQSPCSLIDNCANIEHLSISGTYYSQKVQQCVSPGIPQLKSLALFTHPFNYSLLASVKSHINELRSLKCAMSAVQQLPELLGVCAQTLEELDIDLGDSIYCIEYDPSLTVEEEVDLPKLTPIPPNLHLLTLHAIVIIEEKCYSSCLPAAAKIINSFASSLGHLIVAIDIDLGCLSSFIPAYLSPLSVLGAASLSIPRTDLYVRTGKFPAAVTLARILSCLADYDNVMRSIEQGRLVIHSETAAPAYVVDDDDPDLF